MFSQIGVLFLVFACFVNSQNLGVKETVEDEILKQLQEYNKQLVDPYLVEDIHWDIPQNDYLNGFVHLTKLSLSGFKNSIVSNLHYNWLTHDLTLNINSPKIELILEYQTNLTVGISTDKIIDNVVLRLTVDNISILTDSKLFHLITIPQVFGLSSKVEIGDLNFSIEGFMSDEQISKDITDSVNKYLLDYLKDQDETIEKVRDPLVQTALNKILIN